MQQRYRNIGISIIIALLAALSTYYTTIGGLKLEVANKAEEAFVASLDKRITKLEVRLAENFATKEDFYRLKEDLIVRLSRIEVQLNKSEEGVRH